MESKRDIAVDLAKVLGIALVVLGHISGKGDGPGLIHIRTFLYQFHIPLFFFLSGYCFKESDSWKSFVIKKIRSLYFPFILWNLIFLSIHVLTHRWAGENMAFITILKHCLKIILGIAQTPLGGATWFLITLLQALFLYKLLLTISLRFKNGVVGFLLTASLIIGISGSCFALPWGLDRAFVALAFICFGHLAKKLTLLDLVESRFLLPISAAGISMVYLCSLYNYPDIAFRQYGMIPLFWVSATIGSLSILLLCSSLSKVGTLVILSKLGQKTIWILIGHIAAFKLVSALQIGQHGQVWEALFSHPCNYVGGWWPLVYFPAGFFIPLALSKLSGR